MRRKGVGECGCSPLRTEKGRMQRGLENRQEKKKKQRVCERVSQAKRTLFLIFFFPYNKGDPIEQGRGLFVYHVLMTRAMGDRGRKERRRRRIGKDGNQQTDRLRPRTQRGQKLRNGQSSRRIRCLVSPLSNQRARLF